jgi:hypothetical protein
MAAIHERFHQEDVVFARRLDHHLGLRIVQGQWLLAQDVFAGFGCFDRPFRVHRVRQGDIHHIHFRISEQVFVGGVAFGHVAERLGVRAAGHGDQRAGFRAL